MSALKPSIESATSSDLRARILFEATRLFATRGYAATSIREVVAACGCTKPALYYYFRSKDALFIEAIRAETAIVSELATREVGPDRSARDAIREGFERYLDHVAEHPMGMRLLSRADLQPDDGQPDFDFVSVRSMHFQLVRGLIEAGVARGEIRADVDVDDATSALLGMIERAFQEWLRGQPLPKDLPRRVLSIFFEGVAAKG